MNYFSLYLKGLICFCLLFITMDSHALSIDKGYRQNKIKDLALIYQGGVHRIDWTSDQFLPYVVHQFADGHKDWLFDGFLFLEFTDGKGCGFATRYSDKNARKTEWLWLLDRLFEDGKALSALDRCIGTQIKEIGKPDFTHQIVLCLPEVLPGQKDWGEVDGEPMDFSRQEDQVKATRWYIDELMKRFKQAKYKHLKLSGFYWLAEDIDFTKDLSVPLSKYIHSMNKTFCWIPYWQAKGYNQWKELGFDIAYQQPNHFFKASIPDKRLEEACQSAATLNMGMELEFDERALFDAKDSFYNRLVAYIDHFERQQAFRTSAMAYYSGNHAVLDMYKSTNPKDHEVMDRLANLIVSRRGKQKKESHQTKVIAHRGFWNTPGSAQNSLAALVKADSIGCYGSEFDVWLTADDELMLNHDGWHDGYSLEKTSSDVLRTLKLSNGENMPTLEQFLDKAKKLKIHLILEMKPLSTPERETKAVEMILKLVEEKKLTHRVEYISFSRHVMCEFIRLAPPKTPILYLGQDISPKELKQLGATGADYNYWAYHKNPDWLKDLKNSGMTSNVWTVNIPSEMQWCIDNGFDLITTDAPTAFLGL